MSNESNLRLLRAMAYNQSYPNLNKASPAQVKLVNIFLSSYCETRQERLWILGEWFQRRFETSKELTRDEAKALLDMAFTENYEHDTEFVDFLRFYIADFYQF